MGIESTQGVEVVVVGKGGGEVWDIYINYNLSNRFHIIMIFCLFIVCSLSKRAFTNQIIFYSFFLGGGGMGGGGVELMVCMFFFVCFFVCVFT